jgi:GxxExxY protein
LAEDGLHEAITRTIIGAAYEVHRELGRGFLEKVYVTALAHELSSKGLKVGTETPIDVIYKGTSVGYYFADLLVEGVVICEAKAVRNLIAEHEAQLLHYLRATGIRVGLLLNFGSPSVQIKRMVQSPKENP